MKKSAPYLLSLFLLMCANVALAVNPSGEVMQTNAETKELNKEAYNFTLFDFFQPFNREKTLP